jgi:hypothetical protein
MDLIDKERCIKLKACFGLEHLHFYRYNTPSGAMGALHCKYITDPYDFVTEDELDLRFILSSLSIQQCKVFFDDANEDCIGIDQLKTKYLIFRLAGL